VDADEAIQIKSSQRRALEFDISVNNTSLGEAGLEVPVFAYKGFEALTDEGKLDIGPGQSDRIRLSVPAGFSGDIHIRFREPFYWRLAELLSAVSWILFAGYILKFAIGRKTVSDDRNTLH
ncbi:MAG: hypothetical protein K5770_19730, partial [Lachnospiraceae bacterium]|nr:hypothetical protein [Lachnospiraceae bacterium]